MTTQIEARQRIMYWAPTRRRHYATLAQACKAEAGAILTREWRIDGECDGRWIEDPDWVMRRAQLIRQIEDQFRAQVKP